MENKRQVLSSLPDGRMNPLQPVSKSIKNGCYKLILSFAFVLQEKRLNRNTKLIAILRRQFYITLTALEEKIFSILGTVASRLRPLRNIFSSN